MSPLPPPPPPQAEPEDSLLSILASEWAREVIMTVGASSTRSAQAQLGSSEIGQQCPRRLAYRAVGAPYVNMPDTTKALIGTGFHLAMGEGMPRLDLTRNRYLVEHPVSYRGIPGTVDLYDRFKRRAVDWKTSEVKRIRRYRREGVPVNYRVQTAIYAEGLRAIGEAVDSIALVFVPRDGESKDIWAWVGQPDQALADEYIDRYHAIRDQALADGPAVLEAVPGPLCTYCPNHQAHASDLTLACPGKDV